MTIITFRGLKVDGKGTVMGRKARVTNKTLTMVQCDRFHVVGVRAGLTGRLFGPKQWRITEALGVRMTGGSFALDSIPGAEVTIVANDFPVMVTEIEPHTPSHTAILKAYRDLEQKARVQKAGIVLPGQEAAG